MKVKAKGERQKEKVGTRTGLSLGLLLPSAALLLPFAFFLLPSAAAAPVQLQSALSGDRARGGESELGNLVADALRTATGADIALVAAGELREETLPPGAVMPERLQQLVANGDEPVAVLSVSGATLRGALEVAVSLYPHKNKGFLQVSGMRFTFDPARPEGSRVVARSVGGQPMQDGRQYRVAMSSSLAAGQYGYYRLWNREKAAAAQGLTMAGALEQYLRDHHTLAPRLEGRIGVQGTANH
jgi:2',3'-cyclic-nucleotide 2'-phosphodiesterase (5'-nucleotidase family)